MINVLCSKNCAAHFVLALRRDTVAGCHNSILLATEMIMEESLRTNSCSKEGACTQTGETSVY